MNAVLERHPDVGPYGQKYVDSCVWVGLSNLTHLVLDLLQTTGDETRSGPHAGPGSEPGLETFFRLESILPEQLAVRRHRERLSGAPMASGFTA